MKLRVSINIGCIFLTEGETSQMYYKKEPTGTTYCLPVLRIFLSGRSEKKEKRQ